ncbi:glycosyltransferase [Micrococcus luteus]|uniref:glycosyltransferase n=1 Tax=Micrococcus luteus TaxID=1270 RepID=UPI00385D71FE
MTTEIPGLVSIVIGCFNADPAHLSEALDSALTQSYDNVEVIVVDDGSTRADTRATLAEYEGRVQVVRQENAGVAAARNAGVSVARGEFIQIFDSDDRLGSNIVQQGTEVLRDEAVEIAYSSADVFGAENRYFEAGFEYSLSDIIDTNHITGCAMVRRSRWVAIGGQYADLRDGYEDYEFWIRVLRDGGIARRTPSARFHYRIRPGSRSGSITEGAMDRTRDVVIRTNPHHHEELLRAAFRAMDRLDAEKREYVAYVQQWQRRTRPIIALRDTVRRIARPNSRSA